MSKPKVLGKFCGLRWGMSKPKVFGKFCGLGCRGIISAGDFKTIQIKFEYGCAKYEDVLTVDQATNQIERCPQCLADFPVEESGAPYGYCPICGAEGIARERRLNGNDRCENAHSYPSKEANPKPEKE